VTSPLSQTRERNSERVGELLQVFPRPLGPGDSRQEPEGQWNMKHTQSRAKRLERRHHRRQDLQEADNGAGVSWAQAEDLFPDC
jgi:hypothetical protein